MRNAIRLMPIVLCLALLGGTSCVRYKTTSSRFIDTIYVDRHDTTTVVMEDAGAEIRVQNVIDTVLVEIERDCPNIAGAKKAKYAKYIKEACTMQSLTGGELKATSPDLMAEIRLLFKNNEVTAVWELKERQVNIQDKTETVRDQSYFRKVLDTWAFWAFPWTFLLLWFVVRFLK